MKKSTKGSKAEPKQPANPASRAVATRPQSGKAIANTAPVGGRGFENIEKSDILLPRIKLLQALSPEVTNELAMKPGTMLVGLTNLNLGTKILITPILHFRSRIKWFPKDDGGGIECSSPDGKKPMTDMLCSECGVCKFKDWNDTGKTVKEQAPACTLYENFLVLVGDKQEPVLLPMERTKLKTAKKFYSMGALKNCDMWNFQYELSVAKDKNDKDQPYFNYVITDTGKVTSEARREFCEGIWKSLSRKVLQANDLGNPDEEAGGAGTSAEPTTGKF